jgi:hypothetical protein
MFEQKIFWSLDACWVPNKATNKRSYTESQQVIIIEDYPMMLKELVWDSRGHLLLFSTAHRSRINAYFSPSWIGLFVFRITVEAAESR